MAGGGACGRCGGRLTVWDHARGRTICPACASGPGRTAAAVPTVLSLLLLAFNLWFLWVGRPQLIRIYEDMQVGALHALTLRLFFRSGPLALTAFLIAKEFSGWKGLTILVNAAVLVLILIAAFLPLIRIVPYVPGGP